MNPLKPAETRRSGRDGSGAPDDRPQDDLFSPGTLSWMLYPPMPGGWIPWEIIHLADAQAGAERDERSAGRPGA